MKMLKLVLIAAGVLYIAVAALVYFGQRKMLYFPPDIYLDPVAVGVNMSKVKYSNDQVDITAWYGAPRERGGKTLMVFHGNASAVYSNADMFKELMDAGYGVWSAAYPGYPGSAGTPSQKDIVFAAERQYDFLIMNGVEPDNIIFYGSSLGAGVAAQLAAKHKPGLLIVNAPFNSAVDMGRMRLPFLPVGLLMKDPYRSDQALKGLDVPLIWIHGTNDSVIPIAQGQKLFDGYQGPKTAHIIEGGEHNNLWVSGGREIVLAALRPH